jgi:hypothetical protein
MEAEANISPRAGNQTRPKQKVLAGLLLTPSAVQLQKRAKKKLVLSLADASSLPGVPAGTRKGRAHEPAPCPQPPNNPWCMDVPLSLLTARLMGITCPCPQPPSNPWCMDVPLSLLTARLMGITCPCPQPPSNPWCMDVPLSLLTARLMGITCPCPQLPSNPWCMSDLTPSPL